MRKLLGTILICIGVAAILGAAALFMWNRRVDTAAGELAQQVLPQMVETIRENEDASTPPDPYSSEMTAVTIDGYDYVGFLSLEALGLELPVMANWSYPQLKLSPCRYYGSVRGGDLVICAHNYQKHFGRLTELAVGDSVLFTDMDGVVTAYTVAETEVLQPTAVEEMTSGDYPLTLFSCTYGGKTRVTVRCQRVEGSS